MDQTSLELEGEYLVWEVAGINITQIITVVIVLIATYAIARIISRTLKKIFEKTLFPEEIERWIVRISKYAVYTVGLLVAISMSGFDLTSVIVGLGAFSIAISFAMSNIIQNFVSGILVQADRIFKVGDEIKVQAYEGKVVKVSVRTTTVETNEGDIVSIPNSIFATNPVVKRNKHDDA